MFETKTKQIGWPALFVSIKRQTLFCSWLREWRFDNLNFFWYYKHFDQLVTYLCDRFYYLLMRDLPINFWDRIRLLVRDQLVKRLIILNFLNEFIKIHRWNVLSFTTQTDFPWSTCKILRCWNFTRNRLYAFREHHLQRFKTGKHINRKWCKYLNTLLNNNKNNESF